MTVTIRDRKELHAYLMDSLALAMVKESGLGRKLFLAYCNEVVFRQYEFKSGPLPFSLIFDITALVFLGDQVRFAALDRFPAGFGRGYREFLDILQRYDDSVAEVSQVVVVMTGLERDVFLPFFLQVLAKRMDSWADPDHKFEFDYFSHNEQPVTAKEYRALTEGGKPLFAASLQQSVKKWLNNFFEERQSLFTEDDLFVFHYYVKLLEMFCNGGNGKQNNKKLTEEELEKFLVILRQYGLLMAGFQPYDNEVIRKARKIRETLVPVEEESLFAYGGYAGLRPSGNLDRAESLLPAELAFMEKKTSDPDLFDVHLVEDRLLFFTRDRNFSLRKRRCFHIIFWEPEGMDYKSDQLPARWPFVFLAILFQMIGLFRDHFSLRYYPFQFVFGGVSDYGEEIGNLLTLLAKRDFPDIRITSQVVGKEDMEEYFDREVKGFRGDHTCIFIGRRQDLSTACLPERYQDLHQIRVFFAGGGSGKKISCGILDRKDSVRLLTEEDEVWQTLHHLRDQLTLEVIAGRLYGG